MTRRSHRSIAVIDAETDPFLHGRIPEPFIWGFYDGERFRTFERTADLIDFLKPLDYIVYAHNGGKFDYHLDGFLRELTPYQEVMLINGRLARFTIGNCEFRDSVNILPIALRDFQKDDIDYVKLERENRQANMPEIIRYLRKDCTSLFTLISAFIEKYGINLTLAGAAMKQWQKISGEGSARNNDAEYFDTMRPYYYGGRVECFRKGLINEPFKLVDINSAYPFAMLSWHAFARSHNSSTPPLSDKIYETSFYHIDATSAGAFPLRAKSGLSFPRTRSEFWVTGWELKTAIECNRVQIHAIKTRIDFGKLGHFREYIAHFYEMKKKASADKHSPDYIFAKLFMNSLYGKFGSNPNEYNNFEVIPKDEIQAASTIGWQFVCEIGRWAVVQKPLDEEKRGFFNLATAASITGFVRALLFRHLCAIESAGGSPLYCDTDSIAYIGSGKMFTISKELGDWSEEGATEAKGYDFGAIAGKKLYAFRQLDGKWKTACKGVRLTPEQICYVASGGEVQWKKESPSYSLKSGPRMLTRKIRMT